MSLLTSKHSILTTKIIWFLLFLAPLRPVLGQFDFNNLYDVSWLPTGYLFGDEIIRLPQKEAGLFIFQKDSLYTYHNPETGMKETMSYTVSDDMIIMETFISGEVIVYKVLFLSDERLIVKPYNRDADGNLVESQTGRVVFRKIE